MCHPVQPCTGVVVTSVGSFVTELHSACAPITMDRQTYFMKSAPVYAVYSSNLARGMTCELVKSCQFGIEKLTQDWQLNQWQRRFRSERHLYLLDPISDIQACPGIMPDRAQLIRSSWKKGK